jgi:hypothetical protein
MHPRDTEMNAVDPHAPAGATRTETDSMGPVQVPADHYWGAQTQRSLHHFAISRDTMPVPVVHAFGILKRAAAMWSAVGNVSFDDWLMFTWSFGWIGVLPPRRRRSRSG